MTRKTISLQDDEQHALFQEAKRAVAHETGKEYLRDGDVVEALCRAWLGHRGWDDVGTNDGRGQVTPRMEIVDEPPARDPPVEPDPRPDGGRRLPEEGDAVVATNLDGEEMTGVVVRVRDDRADAVQVAGEDVSVWRYWGRTVPKDDHVLRIRPAVRDDQDDAFVPTSSTAYDYPAAQLELVERNVVDERPAGGER